MVLSAVAIRLEHNLTKVSSQSLHPREQHQDAFRLGVGENPCPQSIMSLLLPTVLPQPRGRSFHGKLPSRSTSPVNLNPRKPQLHENRKCPPIGVLF